MKIYTKGGDKGKTSLLGGARLNKSHMRIEAYGSVDELNAYLGLLCDQEVNKTRTDQLRNIQSVLFVIGSHLAAGPEFDSSKLPSLSDSQVQKLEQAIDQMNESLPKLTSFLLPGGHQSVSFAHLARCVCRRAERRVIALSESDQVPAVILVYLNRLSDYLFMLSRSMAQELNVQEIPWQAKS